MATRRINMDKYYTALEAVTRLSANAGRPIDKNYPRTLARYGKVRFIKVGRATLYDKQDIDGYVVSAKRGPKKKRPEAEKIEPSS